MFDTSLLLTAAFVAGALNSVAGGGSFLTLPALVFAGVGLASGVAGFVGGSFHLDFVATMLS